MEDQQSGYDSLKRCILRWELKVERITVTDVSWEEIPGEELMQLFGSQTGTRCSEMKRRRRCENVNGCVT